ncbi:ACP S-malonyltransferase [Bacillus sp. CH30_1T]|uniref:ACP S-malonyltransferase n=1 Tax=Bacillus sp. CH30_1T TaxID=2604836 RepID=UPI0011EC5EE0|nr:ACP S-malonyltransferase [Bacillus sp. CH30_1T]KAA0560853.1 ACP S-malonyltransferase [Bacillus sp. CH30_1T]
MSKAFIFPGQGSQHIGMAKDFYKQFPSIFTTIFEEAEDALGVPLKKLCFFGPNETLTSTDIAQPAILTTSVGVYKLLESEGVTPDYVAGHSIGQFSALVAAGSYQFSDALKIVHQRGKSMARVKRKGTMLAVVGSKEEQILEVIDKSFDFNVELAAHNSPLQIVFSGEVDLIVKFKEYMDSIPGIKTKLLNVSQGFHSKLMEEMESGFYDYVSGFSLNEPEIPIILNCDSKLTWKKAAILEDIRLQCTQPVLWKQTIESLHSFDIQEIFEVGPSKTLSGLMRSFGKKAITTYSTESVMSYKKSVKKSSKTFMKEY